MQSVHKVSSYFKSQQQQQSPIMCKALSCLRAHSFPLILQYNGSFLVPFSPIPPKGEKFCSRICTNPLIFCSLISYKEAALTWAMKSYCTASWAPKFLKRRLSANTSCSHQRAEGAGQPCFQHAPWSMLSSPQWRFSLVALIVLYLLVSSPEQMEAGPDRAFCYARCHHCRAQLREITSAKGRGGRALHQAHPATCRYCVCMPLHLCASKYIPATAANILIAIFHVASTKFHVVCQDRWRLLLHKILTSDTEHFQKVKALKA